MMCCQSICNVLNALDKRRIYFITFYILKKCKNISLNLNCDKRIFINIFISRHFEYQI